jgi:hypothetical protein
MISIQPLGLTCRGYAVEAPELLQLLWRHVDGAGCQQQVIQEVVIGAPAAGSSRGWLASRTCSDTRLQSRCWQVQGSFGMRVLVEEAGAQDLLVARWLQAPRQAQLLPSPPRSTPRVAASAGQDTGFHLYAWKKISQGGAASFSPVDAMGLSYLCTVDCQRVQGRQGISFGVSQLHVVCLFASLHQSNVLGEGMAHCPGRHPDATMRTDNADTRSIEIFANRLSKVQCTCL